MSQITNALGLGGGNAAAASSTDAFGELDTSVFLDLMIAELQNQDPLNPAENDELLNQIYQIRQIESNESLTGTLESVLLGQNVSTATSLIGADVEALNDSGNRVSGNVRTVTITDGEPSLELAAGTRSTGSAIEGPLAPGNYKYEVTWTNPDGVVFSVPVDANTTTFTEFNGTVELRNLPTNDSGVEKRVFRTDSSGNGDKRLIGTLQALDTRFVDTVTDSQRQSDVLSGPRQTLTDAAKETVRLGNVGKIQPPN